MRKVYIRQMDHDCNRNKCFLAVLEIQQWLLNLTGPDLNVRPCSNDLFCFYSLCESTKVHLL